MAGKLPYTQIYVGDFLSSTMSLTAEQTGGYIRIWMSMWNAGGSLPNDPAKLARISGVSLSRWERIAPDILEFFTIEGDRLTQEKLTFEYRRAEEIVEKRSAAGKKGNRAKSLKSRKRGPASGKANHQQGERISDSDLDLELNLQSHSEIGSAEADVPVGSAAAIFDQGRRYLQSAGVSEKSARSNLGRWRRDHGDESLLAALEEARRQGAIEPIAFINAILLKQRRQPNNSFGARSAQDAIEGV